MKRAYFCIDGFSFRRISDFYRYEHKARSRLNIAAIETYLRFEITRRLDWNCSTEALDIEKHFYQPSESSQMAFEQKLVGCGYKVHYSKRANVLEPKPNSSIFPDWIIARAFRKYDIFILLTTQGQYANIFKQAKKCKIPSLLIGWNSPCKNSGGIDSRWKTDKKLIGYASTYCPLEKTLNQDESVFADVMFEKFCPNYPSDLLYG